MLNFARGISRYFENNESCSVQNSLARLFQTRRKSKNAFTRFSDIYSPASNRAADKKVSTFTSEVHQIPAILFYHPNNSHLPTLGNINTPRMCTSSR